ncbi:MAG: ATP-binding cassette domain-containing protein, partial [Terracidiphilus sp.]
MAEIVSVDAVTRKFPLNHDPTHNLVSALNNVNLRVQAGEFLAIAGPSGSGKTTLLNIIGCIDEPTNGRILIEGMDSSSLTTSRRTTLRRQKIGFVFQTFNLIPVF